MTDKESSVMKKFVKVMAIIAAIAAAFAVVGMCARIFRTKMTRYYKVY